MKLLMITRKVDKNDSLAGFTYHWVKKLSENVEQLFVISWQEGDSSDLPKNVAVTHLQTKQNKLLKILTLRKELKKLLPQVDGLFCHMNPEYTILSAGLAKKFKKRIISWYTHGSISARMKRMEKLAYVVLSASKQSFRLPSKKLVVTGHGIDVNHFTPVSGKDNENFRITTVGRISPTKGVVTMVDAIDIIRSENKDNNAAKKIIFHIIGAPGLKSHKSYMEELKSMVKRTVLTIIQGPVPHHGGLNYFYQRTHLFINLSNTGSLDKAILEAMACGCIVLTSNEAFAEMLPKELMVEKDNPKALAEKIKWVMSLSTSDRQHYQKNLRQIVVQQHNLDSLMKKIVSQFA